MRTVIIISCIALSLLGACGDKEPASTNGGSKPGSAASNKNPHQKDGKQEALVTIRPQAYVPFTLTADLGHLSTKQKAMITELIDAAKIMDDLFWQQALGDKDAFLAATGEHNAKRFAKINYGPWDRLNANQPFLPGFGQKPLGAQFYPADMTKEEFNKAPISNKSSLYTLLKRNKNNQLYAVPYHVAFKDALNKAADHLRAAAALAEHDGFKHYLQTRADALITDNYSPSDLVWMDVKGNPVDIVIGAIENYEDKLFGYKAAYEAYVLIKDMAWSKKLEKFAQFLPELQRKLPVDPKYKSEKAGSDSDLNAYDVIYYAGRSNAGSKTIAINLPNDEKVQLAKGTRRLQLKNAMQAKYEKILLPIADELIDPAQREHITFTAFFENTMFHEVAHGLGIKNTINNKGPVRTALKDAASAIEEGKADILGIYMVSELYKKGELTEGHLMDNYVTFMAGIFRSVRFGASSAHGKANMVRFNYFKDKGAFARNDKGKYRINAQKFALAIDELSREILTLQGNGDYQGATNMLNNQGKIDAVLQSDLDRLQAANIPVDVIFRQGPKYLELK